MSELEKKRLELSQAPRKDMLVLFGSEEWIIQNVTNRYIVLVSKTVWDARQRRYPK